MSKQLESLKDILVPQANPDAGDDLQDGSKEEREAYRFFKKIRATDALPGENDYDKDVKEFAQDSIKADLRYISAAIRLLKTNNAQSRMLAVQLSKKSKDPYVQAFILARLIKDQAEVKAAEDVISGEVGKVKDQINTSIYG